MTTSSLDTTEADKASREHTIRVLFIVSGTFIIVVSIFFAWLATVKAIEASNINVKVTTCATQDDPAACLMQLDDPSGYVNLKDQAAQDLLNAQLDADVKKSIASACENQASVTDCIRQATNTFVSAQLSSGGSLKKYQIQKDQETKQTILQQCAATNAGPSYADCVGLLLGKMTTAQ